MDELYWFLEYKPRTETRENIYIMTMVSREPRQIPSSKAGKPSDGLSCFRADLEAVPIGAGTHLDGKFFVWLRQKLLKSVRIPASFFLARQKIFLANLHTVTYWYSFLISR